MDSKWDKSSPKMKASKITKAFPQKSKPKSLIREYEDIDGSSYIWHKLQKSQHVGGLDDNTRRTGFLGKCTQAC